MSVNYSYSDGIAQITLDDGKVNALSVDTFKSISEALDRIESDRAIP